jgi:site-specific recombinase XerD
MRGWTLTPEKFLDEREVRALRTTLRDKALAAKARGVQAPVRDWAIIDTALSSGLRVSELAALQVGDVAVGHGQAEILVRSGKGGKARQVRIGPDLKAHLREFLAWKEVRGEPVVPEAPLFASERARAYTTRGIQKRFEKACADAGVARRGVHACRHTYASVLYRASGYNLRLVQKQLGHSSIVTTQIYADVFAPEVEAAVRALYAQEASSQNTGTASNTGETGEGRRAVPEERRTVQAPNGGGDVGGRSE